MKLLKTILVAISFISAGLLWITREKYLPSLSAFALSPNAMFYRAMHISMMLFLMINAVDFKKYATEFALAGGMGLILIFDMYNTPTLHNVLTVSTVLLACVTLLVNSKINKKVAWGLIIGAVGIFAYGYFTDFHFLLAEVLCMACLSAGKLVEIYSKGDYWEEDWSSYG